MGEIVGPAGFFLLVYGIVYLYVRKKERMELLRRGLDPNTFRPIEKTKLNLKYGLILCAIGFGMLIAKILIVAQIMEPQEGYLSMIFIFGGASLLIYYFWEKKLASEKEKLPNDESQSNL